MTKLTPTTFVPGLAGRDWWMLPKTPDVHVSDAEWEYYCWKTRRQRERPAVAEVSKKPVSTGATAGWRSGYY